MPIKRETYIGRARHSELHSVQNVPVTLLAGRLYRRAMTYPMRKATASEARGASLTTSRTIWDDALYCWPSSRDSRTLRPISRTLSDTCFIVDIDAASYSSAELRAAGRGAHQEERRIRKAASNLVIHFHRSCP